MPIFKYVEKNKKSQNIDLNFFAWKNGNLKVELEEDSSILNISYQDQDKEIIIPVLEKINYAYQSYSGKNKKREFKLAKDYLEEQIKIYGQKSLLSLKQAQEFAIKEDLTYPAPRVNLIDSEDSELSGGYEIELQRVKAANKIRNLKAQVKRIKELEIYSDESVAFFTKILKLKFSEIVDQLNEIDNKLLVLKSKYTENDISIIRAKKDRGIIA